MSLYHYNSSYIVCVLQAKPEHSFSPARSCVYIAFSECQEIEVTQLFVTGPAKTGHICTNYMCLEYDTFFDHCV